MADNMAQSGKLVKGISATYVEEMSIKTPERYEIRCITREVQAVIGRSGIDDGIVLVNPMHITASVYVNDLEYGLHHDIMQTLEKLAPYHGPEGKSGAEYQHHRTGEDNGDAHLRRQLLGQQVCMPFQDGQLHLGTWEQIHYAEFDGQRNKRILVKVLGVICDE
jgi:secondary thiamine-phosphate synthase enzyme|tara:strand:+ start:828 stop:1319 length:492 start_codon:yes stop_codon:yes gene_type:complete